MSDNPDIRQVERALEADDGQPEPKVRTVRLRLCELCLDGKGGECHVPGCALWINRAPDLPIHRELYEIDPPPDAALEALRPFARMGVLLRRLESPPSTELHVRLGFSVREDRSLKAAHCLAALEFWQSHGPGEEP